MTLRSCMLCSVLAIELFFADQASTHIPAHNNENLSYPIYPIIAVRSFAAAISYSFSSLKSAFSSDANFSPKISKGQWGLMHCMFRHTI